MKSKKKTAVDEMSIKELRRALEVVREMLAQRQPVQRIENHLHIQYNLKPLVKCQGEAHTNAHIDHCAMCLPYFGWVEAAE